VHGLQAQPKSTWFHEAKQKSVSERNGVGSSSLRKLFGAKLKSHKDAEQKFNTRKDTSGSVYWPQGLLPDGCPNARIMTWGYDTVVSKGYTAADNSSIFAHAKDLLYALDRNRR
jgi:hypothetical protein